MDHLEEKDLGTIVTASSFSPDSSRPMILDSNSIDKVISTQGADLIQVQSETAQNTPSTSGSKNPLVPEVDTELHQIPRVGKQLETKTEVEDDSYGQPLTNQLDSDYLYSSDYDYYSTDDYADYQMTMSHSEPFPGLSVFERNSRVDVPPFLPGAFALPISEAFNQFDQFGPQRGFDSFNTNIVTESKDENGHQGFFSGDEDFDYEDFGARPENFRARFSSPIIRDNNFVSQSTGKTESFESKKTSRKEESLSPKTSKHSKPKSQSLPRLQKQYNGETPDSGVDFSQAVVNSEGKRCVVKNKSVENVKRQPILECTHKNVEKCHYTYVTVFNPQQEEQCEENFEKSCQITFRPEATRETVRKCYRPQRKVCNGQGPQQCRTEYESSCTTRWVKESVRLIPNFQVHRAEPWQVCGGHHL